MDQIKVDKGKYFNHVAASQPVTSEPHTKKKQMKRAPIILSKMSLCVVQYQE